MQYEEFLRVYAIRAPNVMWFLGAGSSASAGIPTASDLIWQFKRTLYCAAQRVSIKTCEDLSSPVVRRKLQSYFDSLGSFPPENSSDEYAFYFEETYRDPADRRAVIDKFVSGATPSFGHRVLGNLLKLGKSRIVWTPNFDRLIEDSAAKVFGGTSRIVTASLDSARLALEAMNEGRWPLIAKLHGDFQSRRLKNTADELREQDSEMRRALVESCRRYGLAVVGYSGRDESIMAALEDATKEPNAYPNGLFWFHRSDSALFDAAKRLIEQARAAGVQAQVIEVQTFDELMGDLVRQFSDLPEDVIRELGAGGGRISDVPPVPLGKGWPVVRLNAIPILEWPSICRRIECAIGGAKAVKEVADANGNIIAGRRNVGVLAFGDDAEIRKAFTPFGINAFDLHSIEPSRLRYESVEQGLVAGALARAIRRCRPLAVERRGPAYICMVTAGACEAPELRSLKQQAGQLTGVIQSSGVAWAEAIRISIQHRLGRLWLIFEPTVWIEKTDNDDQMYDASEFVRERMATRYNAQFNSLIAAWAAVLFGDGKPLKAFDTPNGTDAVFRLGTTTAFSRRLHKA